MRNLAIGVRTACLGGIIAAKSSCADARAIQTDGIESLHIIIRWGAAESRISFAFSVRLRFALLSAFHGSIEADRSRAGVRAVAVRAAHGAGGAIGAGSSTRRTCITVCAREAGIALFGRLCNFVAAHASG